MFGLICRLQALRLLQKLHRTGLFADVRGDKYDTEMFIDSRSRLYRFVVISLLLFCFFFHFWATVSKMFALCCLSILSVTLVYNGPTIGCIKMPLGADVGLGPGHIVLDGDPAPPKGAQPPQFSAHVCLGQTAGWIKMSLGREVGLGPGDIVLDGTQLSHPNFRPMATEAKRLDGSRCHFVWRLDMARNGL